MASSKISFSIFGFFKNVLGFSNKSKRPHPGLLFLKVKSSEHTSEGNHCFASIAELSNFFEKGQSNFFVKGKTVVITSCRGGFCEYTILLEGGKTLKHKSTTTDLAEKIFHGKTL